MDLVNTIVQASTAIGGIGVIAGALYGIFCWFNKQEKQTKDIEELQSKETDDINGLKDLHSQDMDTVILRLMTATRH